MTTREKLIREAATKKVACSGFRRRLERWLNLKQTETTGTKFRYWKL